MAEDVTITRTIAASNSDFLLEILVVPVGENTPLQPADVSATILARTFAEGAPSLDSKGGTRDVADVLSSIADGLDAESADELREIVQQDYIPVPQSPTFQHIALSGLVGTKAIELTAGEDVIGLAVSDQGFIVLAVVILAGSPFVNAIRSALARTAQYALVLYDRKTLAPVFGFQLPATDEFPEPTQTPPDDESAALLGMVRVREGGGTPHGFTGNPQGATLIFRLLATNDSDHDVSIMNPSLEFEIAGLSYDFKGMHTGSETRVVTAPAHQAVELSPHFSVRGLTVGDLVQGILTFETSYEQVPVESFRFRLTAFSR